MYEIAVGGTDDEKISAATIFCGASLTRGWSIQVIDFEFAVQNENCNISLFPI